MEDTLMTGNTANRAGSMMRDTVNRAKDAAGQYMDNDPKAHPMAEHREGPLARAIEQRRRNCLRTRSCGRPSDPWAFRWHWN